MAVTAPSNHASKPSVTELIAQADANVPLAVNSLFDLLYADLHRVASHRVRGNNAVMDLSATALVHETYERLVQLQTLKVSDRKQFFKYAAFAMRSVVVDMARARLTERSGAGGRIGHYHGVHIVDPAR